MMMISPNCPEHDRLVLDLALGRLDDDAAAEAETVGETCPVCRAWWQAQFGQPAAEIVDGAVASVFEDLDLPERRRGHGRMALAAAMVMALGATTLWLVQSPTTPDANPVNPVVVQRMAAIQSMDFETPAAVRTHTQRSDGNDGEIATEFIASRPTERAALATDEIALAEAVPSQIEGSAVVEPLSASGFESGDLSEWDPST